MRKQVCIPGSFLPAHTQEPGKEARHNTNLALSPSPHTPKDRPGTPWPILFQTELLRAVCKERLVFHWLSMGFNFCHVSKVVFRHHSAHSSSQQ